MACAILVETAFICNLFAILLSFASNNLVADTERIYLQLF